MLSKFSRFNFLGQNINIWKYNNKSISQMNVKHGSIPNKYIRRFNFFFCYLGVSKLSEYWIYKENISACIFMNLCLLLFLTRYFAGWSQMHQIKELVYKEWIFNEIQVQVQNIAYKVFSSFLCNFLEIPIDKIYELKFVN